MVVGPGGSFRPLTGRNFRLLWLGRVSSSLGDVLVPVALAFAVLALRDSSFAYGLVLAAFTASRVTFSLVAGVVADRLPRRSVLLASDGVRAVIEAATAALVLTHQMTLPLFVLAVVLFGAASAFFGPASTALVPAAVAPADLQAANALLRMPQSFLNVFGPAVSGVLIVATHTTGWVFALDAATFVASAAFLSRLDVDEQQAERHVSFGGDLRDGYREVRARPWVSSALTAFAISNLCLASFLVLGPVIVRHHGGAGQWGLVAATGAFGLFAGSLLTTRIRPARPLAAAFSAAGLLAAPIAALARPLPTAALAAAFAVGMASTSFANTVWETTLQRRIGGSLLARVRSYDQLVSYAFMPIGYVAFGALADSVGTTPTLVATACVVAATNLVIASLPCVRELGADEPALAAPHAA
jgi:MFS family permease